MTKRFRLSAALMLAVLQLVWLGGCLGKLQQPPVEKRSFDLAMQRSGGKAQPVGDALVVRRLGVSPRYAGRELVYRRDETSFVTDYYNVFFVSPSDMLTQGLREWLAAGGLYRHVLEPSSLARPQLWLEGNVSEFYGDYSGSQAKAVVAMQFALLDENGPETRIEFSGEYRREVPCAGKDPKALVLAMRQAVAEIYGELEKDLASGRRQ